MLAYSLLFKLVFISSLWCQCCESQFSNGCALWKGVCTRKTKSGLKRIVAFKEGLHVPFLITYFVEYFNVCRSEMMASSEECADTSWIARWNRVCSTTIGMRSCVARNVARYVDVVFAISGTKSGSITGTTKDCICQISILGQSDRVISICVVKREDESFTGCGVSARTWNVDKRIVTLKNKSKRSCRDKTALHNCSNRTEVVDKDVVRSDCLSFFLSRSTGITQPYQSSNNVHLTKKKGTS